MRFVLNMLDMPWWGMVATLLAFVAIAVWFRITFPRKFERIVREGVLEAGSALKDAQVTVHSVKAVEAPKGRSPYDLDEDDENFMEGVDDVPWDEEGTKFYSIDATIEPTGDGLWDPTGLALVPAEYEPDDEIDISEELCALYSAEEFVDGRWQPTPEKEVRGPRRLRMLFAVHEHLTAVMFANIVTYFGHVNLPK
jgi:hypothetical protein